MLSDEVASDKRYIKWMESFTKSSKVSSYVIFLTAASGYGTETDSRQLNFTRPIHVGSGSEFVRRLNISTSPSRWRTCFNAKLVFKEIYTCTSITLSIQGRQICHRCETRQ